MSDLMQEHLAVVSDRLKAKNLSRLELTQEAEQRLTVATDDNISTQARELAAAEHKLITGLLAEATPTPLAPPDNVSKWRDAEQHVLAETLEHGIKVQAKRDELEQARIDRALIADDDNFAGRERERLTAKMEQLSEEIDGMAISPYHQRQQEAKRIRGESEQAVNKASVDLQFGHITEAQFEEIQSKATEDSIAARDAVNSGAA